MITEEYKSTDANMIRVMETIEACQKHTTHVLSCRKGVIGRVHCRFSCPRGRHENPTGPLEIEGFYVQVSPSKSVVEARLRGDGTVTNPPKFDNWPTSSHAYPTGDCSSDHRVPESDSMELDDAQWFVTHGVANVTDEDPSSPSRSNAFTGNSTSRITTPARRLDHPPSAIRDIVGPRDNRLIVWEMHRATDDDMRVIEFSPTLTACIASNATVSMLGDKTQAKAVVHYMVKYMTKDSTSLNNVLPLIWEAQQTTVKFGSTAPDKAEASRVFKFLTTRILNNLSGRQEISASQAASALMGYGSTLSSSGFWLCYHEPARQQMMRDLGFDPVLDNGEWNSEELEEEGSDDEGGESEEFCETDIIDLEPEDTDFEMSRDIIESTVRAVPLDFGESFAYPGGLSDSDQLGGGRRLPRAASSRAHEEHHGCIDQRESSPSNDPAAVTASTTSRRLDNDGMITFVSPVSDTSHRNALRETRRRGVNPRRKLRRFSAAEDDPEFPTTIRTSRTRASPTVDTGNISTGIPPAEAMDDDITLNDQQSDVGGHRNPDHPGFVEVRIERQGNSATSTPTVEITAQHILYKFRPSELWNMSLYEWCGVVDVVLAKHATKRSSDGGDEDEDVDDSFDKSESTTGNTTGFVPVDPDSDSDAAESLDHSTRSKSQKRAPGAGRPKNGTFSFDPAGGPSLKRFLIKLRSKQLIPIMAGCPPFWPGHPKKTRAWRRAADRYAQAVFATYIPWGPSIVREVEWKPTYNCLCEWLDSAQRPSAPFIDRSRAKLIGNLSEGLRVSEQSRKILSKWRSRDADRWTGTRHHRHEQSARADRVVPGSLTLAAPDGKDKDSLKVMEERIHKDLLECLRQQERKNPQKSVMSNFVDSRVSFVSGCMESSTLNYKSPSASIISQLDHDEDGIDFSTPPEECSTGHVTRSSIVHDVAADMLDGVFEAIASATRSESPADDQPANSAAESAESLPANCCQLVLPTSLNRLHVTDQSHHDESTALEDVEMTSDAIIQDESPVLHRHPQIRENYEKLNANQKVAVDHVVTWSDQMDDHLRDPSHRPAPEQLLLFIHGPPGTGKSFVVETISKALHRGAVIITATTGVAASELPGGTTIAFLSGISPQIAKSSGAPTPMGKAKLQSLCNVVDREVARILIIDEISMASDKALGQYDSRLTEFMSTSGGGVDVGVLPFGGLAVILIGDGYQLPPVKGTSLIKSISSTSRAPNPFETMVIRGRSLFKRFRKLELTQQMRAAEDLDHVNFLGKLRSPSTPPTNNFGKQSASSKKSSGAKGSRRRQPVTSDSRTCVTDADINCYKILCAEDFKKDESWRSATIVVTSNAERHRHNFNMANMFAMHYDTPILTWRNPLSGFGATNLSDMFTEFVYSNWSEDLISIFVAGAPAFLTTNINPSKGLANGTKVRLHSITLDPDGDALVNARIVERINSARPGELIDLGTNVPLSVNVVLDRLSKSRADNWPESERIRVDSLSSATTTRHPSESSTGDEVIIPLLAKQALTGDEIVTNFNHVHSSRDTNAIKFIRHGFDLGFSVTFYKVQGKTINRVILDLAQRPGSHQVSHPALYVGMSRIRRSQDLRLLPLDPNSKQRLRNLRPSRDLLEWLSSFEYDKPSEPPIWSQKANDTFNRRILESSTSTLNSATTVATATSRRRNAVTDNNGSPAVQSSKLVPARHVHFNTSGTAVNGPVPVPPASTLHAESVRKTLLEIPLPLQGQPSVPTSESSESGVTSSGRDTLDVASDVQVLDKIVNTPRVDSSNRRNLPLGQQLYLSNLRELEGLGYSFDPKGFQFISKCHVTAYDKLHQYYAAAQPSDPTTERDQRQLRVSIRVIDFLNYSETHVIISQLRRLIPDVTFVSNILEKKQHTNSCGYVAANVSARCAFLFHSMSDSTLTARVGSRVPTSTSGSTDSLATCTTSTVSPPTSTFENDSQTPWSCSFNDACDFNHVTDGNKILGWTVEPRARLIGPGEILRLIYYQYKFRQDELATQVPTSSSASRIKNDLFQTGSRDSCILTMLRTMETCFEVNTPMAHPIIFICNTDTSDKPGLHWITILFDIRHIL